MLLHKLTKVIAVLMVLSIGFIGAGWLGYGTAVGELNENKKADAAGQQREVGSRTALLVLERQAEVKEQKGQARAEKSPAGGGDAKLAIHLAEARPTEGCREAADSSTRRKIYLHTQSVVTEKDVTKVNATEIGNGLPAISVTLTKEGGEKMAKVTEGNLGKMLAILVDGKVLCAPVIRSKLADRVVITGKFTKAETERIARELGRK